MTVTSKPWLATLGLSLGLLASASVQAVDVDKAIQYRQDALRVMAWQMGPLGDMAQGNIDYDAERFALRAGNLAALAGLPWEGFVEGSLRGDGHGMDTDALAAIGDDRDDFEARHQSLVEETATLAALAEGDDFAAMRRQVASVANTCKGCHDNYRAE
ncbi:c-type cytochrome [Halomonas sp. C05BenzN]|uniref:c-type cytochrome n=1 Tax=Halomonas sp. C05BenzN TaxID=3411041 RepID=UPI003B960242